MRGLGIEDENKEFKRNFNRDYSPMEYNKMKTFNMARLIRLSVVVTILLLSLIACSKKYTKYIQGADGQSCEVTQQSNGTLIECYNGNTAFIPNGQNGLDGRDGVDGQDGLNGVDGQPGQSSLLRIVDPCGDGAGPDEVLVVMDDGRVLAWYQNLGLSLLQPNQAYVTTDGQSCKFMVDVTGNVTEL